MPPKTQTGKGIKWKSFNDVCNNFADACSDIDFETDDPASDLLATLRATTENSQGLNESDMTAVKVMQLLLPAVNVLTNRMVIKNYATQDAKIEKIYSAVRLNRYAIDSQNQYSRRENIRISGIVEEEDEVPLDKLSNICNAMGVNVNNADIISCHRVGNKGRPNIPRTVIVRCTRDFKSKVFTNKKTLHGKP